MCFIDLVFRNYIRNIPVNHPIGTIRTLGDYRFIRYIGYYGVSPKLIYEHPMLNIPRGSYEWPITSLMIFDHMFRTRYLFYSDSDFSESDLRNIHSLDPNVSRELNNYSFSTILLLQYSEFIGIQIVNNATLLKVRLFVYLCFGNTKYYTQMCSFIESC